ncbi:MAG: NADPH-dependent FMN reductase [Phycisphaerales bacterium JB059]
MKILAFTGSMRAESLNRRLMLVAINRLKERGAEIAEVQLRDLKLPMFDEDMEGELKAAGKPMPEPVVKLQDLMLDADALLIASPEYNGSVTPALKNAIDWCSRRVDNDGPLACYRGKVAGLMATSGGRLGGIRGLPEVRRILSGIGVHVIAQDFACPGAPMQTPDDWPDDMTRSGAHRVADALYETTAALLASRR